MDILPGTTLQDVRLALAKEEATQAGPWKTSTTQGQPGGFLDVRI